MNDANDIVCPIAPMTAQRLLMMRVMTFYGVSYFVLLSWSDQELLLKRLKWNVFDE